MDNQGFSKCHVIAIINYMTRLFMLISIVVLTSIFSISSAFAAQVSLEDFISQCGDLYKTLSEESPDGKISKNIERQILNKLDKFDPQNKIRDENGNFYIFDWENEIDAIRGSMKNRSDDSTLQSALNDFKAKVWSDLVAAKDIASQKHVNDVKRIQAAVENSLKKNIDVTQVPQPGYGIQDENKEEPADLIGTIIQKIMGFLQKVGQWLDKRIGNATQIPGLKGIENINWVIAILIIAIILFFFVNILPLLRFKRKFEEEHPTDDSTISISLAKALSRADKEAQMGNYIGALRELLRGFFMGLSEIGVIQYKLSRTNREYRRAIPRVAPSYANLARDFLPYMDDVLYGGIQADEMNYIKYKSQISSAFKSQ